MHGHICISRHSPHPCHPHGGRRHWHAGRPRSGCGDWACPKNRPDPTALRPWRRNRTNRPHHTNPHDRCRSGRRMTRNRPWRSSPASGRRTNPTRGSGRNATGHDWRSAVPRAHGDPHFVVRAVREPDHARPTDDPLQRTAAFAVADTLTGPTAAATGPANGTNAGTARKRPTQDASTPDSHDGQDGAQQSNQLDLNTADLGELQTLKGVGPVTAQRILDYRTQIGRFDNVDQLLEVKGIGSKTLAKFRDQVCVR